jgi:hypothetical protein
VTRRSTSPDQRTSPSPHTPTLIIRSRRWSVLVLCSGYQCRRVKSSVITCGPPAAVPLFTCTTTNIHHQRAHPVHCSCRIHSHQDEGERAPPPAPLAARVTFPRAHMLTLLRAVPSVDEVRKGRHEAAPHLDTAQRCDSHCPAEEGTSGANTPHHLAEPR